MECLKVKGLFFIGEVVDVTGHLGGFIFSGWASGAAAGAPYEETGARLRRHVRAAGPCTAFASS